MDLIPTVVADSGGTHGRDGGVEGGDGNVLGGMEELEFVGVEEGGSAC